MPSFFSGHQAWARYPVKHANWRQGNKTTDKVPTELKYSSEYPAPGYKWGFEVENETDKLIWIKLLLDPSQDSFSDDLLATTRALLPKDKKPVDVVTDYLSALKKHTVDVLEGHFGKVYMGITPVEYFLTVPAVGGFLF